ncbi:DUF397 domain-containing protein [Streptomyces varsoviensis]|uniref:DUF397 domain-containing protein n=1 Tax=Streptomyces varsoviensis TaxID=67373 RepID=A0ABR5JC93_9ACTN|nr:DUF397 domain-containing protein [Streptomyces varsoviensis]KOG91069.1 hypothetical protein ADK38_05245 [Streptomyces varsoviensis]
MSQLTWQKSSFSEPGSDTCVEVATDLSGGAHLRESDAPTQVIATTPAALRALLRAVKAGTVGRGAV